MRYLAAICLTALLIPAANAIPVRYDFTVTLADTFGTFAVGGSTNGAGYVVFDTELALLAGPTGQVGNQNVPLPTIDLSFDWLGMHWDESNATLGLLRYSAGILTALGIDAVVPPNSCGNSFQCVQWGTNDFTVTRNSSGAGSALLTRSGSNGVAFGTSRWSGPVQVDVPEPGTLALLGAGLAGLLLFRRRQTRA